MGINIKFFGCRGSITTAESDKLKYGGHTSCVMAECGEDVIVFDAGSGLIGFSEYYMRNLHGKKITIFLSHYHIDHICGLPFADVLYGNATIDLYAGVYREIQPYDILNRYFSPPYFPVDLSNACGNLSINVIGINEPVILDSGAKVTAAQTNHPGGCMCFKLEYQNKKIVYLTDHECDESPSPDMDAFLHNADIVIFDAFFTRENYINGWGHSTFDDGSKLCRDFGIDRLYFTHYNTKASDAALDAIAERYAKSDLNCILAYEGLCIEL